MGQLAAFAADCIVATFTFQMLATQGIVSPDDLQSIEAVVAMQACARLGITHSVVTDMQTMQSL